MSFRLQTMPWKWPRVRDQDDATVSTPVSSWLNFNPLLLSPVAWYDASDTSTITSSSGAVSQWNDKSGNGYHVTQPSSTLQPATGSITQNGLNVIAFGTNEHRLSNTSVTVNQPFTVLMVWKYNSVGIGTTRAALQMGPVSGGGGLVIPAYIGDAEYRVFNGSLVRSGAIATNSVTQATSISNSASTASQVRADGKTVAGPAGSGNNNGTVLHFGGSGVGAFGGFVAECIIVNRAMTANEITVTEKYLRTKWATP